VEAAIGGHPDQYLPPANNDLGGPPTFQHNLLAAMTFCVKNEDIKSCGRAADWGSLTWLPGGVCKAVASGAIEAQGKITLYKKRTGQTSFLFPPSGALGVAMKAGTKAGRAEKSESNSNKLRERSFQVSKVKLMKCLIDYRC